MDVKDSDLQSLFTLCATFEWSAKLREDLEMRLMQDRVNALLSRDYKIGFINNAFCSSYPLEIVLLGDLDYEALENELDHKTRDEILQSINNHEDEAKRLEKLMEQSKLCRCRQRIPAPVLTFRGRTIARSAALSEHLEYAYETLDLSSLSGAGKAKMRANRALLDTQWLGVLKVKYICDLMVEDTKKILALRLSTSENATAEYTNAGFGVNKLPYPGVDAFRNYADHVKSGYGFPIPNWKKAQAQLALATNCSLPDPYKWVNYQQWDLIELTQNYMRYMLNLLRSDPSPDAGILIHCISGWDRTPMFVTLLRILLWAEGEAHQSLSVDQMLYLSVAYDWVLFGHQLAHRLSKRYEIMYFCFYVLQHLLSDEYSYGLGPNGPVATSLTPRPSPRGGNDSYMDLPDIAQPSSSNAGEASSSSSSSSSGSSSTISPDAPKPTLIVTPASEEQQMPASPAIGASATSPPPRSPRLSSRLPPPTNEAELSERRRLRKDRIFELSDKFMTLYQRYTEPLYKR